MSCAWHVGACCGFRSATFPGQTGASGNSKAEFEKKAYTAWKATVSDRTLKTFKPASQFTFTLVSTDSWRARYQSAIVVLANSRDRRRAPYPAGGMGSSWSDIPRVSSPSFQVQAVWSQSFGSIFGIPWSLRGSTDAPLIPEGATSPHTQSPALSYSQ